MSETLLEDARRWLAQDPDPETHTELSALIQAVSQSDAAALAELGKRFNGRLQFGTAGLRGRLQAGPMGMNRVLVAQAAAGLAQYLRENYAEPSVVIGYDGRKNSDIFARDTAEIMAGAGVKALLLPTLTPSPVLAFAVRHFDVCAGVMVTASHNPPEDNGYKVYLGKADIGAQIISPADRNIAACIDRAAAVAVGEYPRSQSYTVSDHTVIDEYIRQTAQLAPEETFAADYVYTAMHGVGTEIFLQALRAAKLPLPRLVAEQCTPDAAFPTVSFPNPEEKGALDLAIKLARENNAEFIIAHDPDADRLAVAVADREGVWKPLHGNVVGCLLAWHLAERAAQNQQGGTLACSLVSSPALGAIAARYGLGHVETPTGFKYVARVPQLLFGFEEALGYLTDPAKVGDKDGISAALSFLDLVGCLKKQGKTINDFIADFNRTFGVYASSQISMRVDDTADIARLMAALRRTPPASIGRFAIAQSIDHLHTDHCSDVLVYQLADGSRLIVRPSGTEPKIKFYLDVRADSESQAAAALQQLDSDVRALLAHYQTL